MVAWENSPAGAGKAWQPGATAGEKGVKTERNIKIEGTNSKIYCKQRSYSNLVKKTNWFLSAKKAKQSEK